MLRKNLVGLTKCRLRLTNLWLLVFFTYYISSTSLITCQIKTLKKKVSYVKVLEQTFMLKFQVQISSFVSLGLESLEFLLNIIRFFKIISISSDSLLPGGQVKVVNSKTRPFITDCGAKKIVAGKICSIDLSDQDGIDDSAIVTYQSSSEDLYKLQIAIASKENILSQTALKVLMKRRDDLVILFFSFHNYLGVLI